MRHEYNVIQRSGLFSWNTDGQYHDGNDGLDRLTHGERIQTEEDSIENQISRGEGMRTEFKASLRRNLMSGNNDPRMEHKEVCNKKVLVIECESSDKPVFLKNEGAEEFYIRAGASSPVLPASQTHEYIQQHFK